MFLNNRGNFSRSLRTILLVASLATLILHLVGTHFYLYWTFRWFDILTHALGGFSVGLFLLFFSRSILPVLGVAIILIIGWEVFEWEAFGTAVSGMYADGRAYLVDTLSDMVIGFLGVLGAILLYRRLR